MRPRFRACYQRVLERQPGAQGTVQLTLHVNCRGTVSWIHARVSGLRQEIVSCMFDVASRVRFEEPAIGWANVRVPVTFFRQ
jgi:hypothetical protein